MRLFRLSDLHLRSEVVVAAIDQNRLSPFLAQIAATVVEVSLVTGDTVSPAQVRLFLFIFAGKITLSGIFIPVVRN